MAEAVETAGAAPSAATAIELPRSGTPEYAEWRLKGTLPDKQTEKPAAADPAPADASKETKSEDAADSAANKTQGKHRKPDAEARIKELAAEAKRLKEELADARKPKETKETKADSSPAPKAESKPAEPAPTRPKPVFGEKGPDGKAKYESYDAFVEDLTDWKTEQKFAAQQREQQAKQQQDVLNKQLDEARARYTDFDSVTKPLVDDLLKPDIPREVFAVMDRSPVLADLLYAIGGTEASKADFLEACRTDPVKALRVALLMEQEIVRELGGDGEKESGGRRENGQFAAKGEQSGPPAKRSPESAPPPPLEIGSRGAAPANESERALSEVERGNSRAFSNWKRAEDAKELRRRRGV